MTEDITNLPTTLDSGHRRALTLDRRADTPEEKI
jgi:hypothetical protein